MKTKPSFTAIVEIADILRSLPTAQQHRVLLAVAVVLGFDGLLRAFYGGEVLGTDSATDDEPEDDEPEPDEP